MRLLWSLWIGVLICSIALRRLDAFNIDQQQQHEEDGTSILDDEEAKKESNSKLEIEEDLHQEILNKGIVEETRVPERSHGSRSHKKKPLRGHLSRSKDEKPPGTRKKKKWMSHRHSDEHHKAPESSEELSHIDNEKPKVAEKSNDSPLISTEDTTNQTATLNVRKEETNATTGEETAVETNGTGVSRSKRDVEQPKPGPVKAAAEPNGGVKVGKTSAKVSKTGKTKMAAKKGKTLKKKGKSGRRSGRFRGGRRRNRKGRRPKRKRKPKRRGKGQGRRRRDLNEEWMLHPHELEQAALYEDPHWDIEE